MTLTPSTMITLGTKAPEFSLPDLDEKVVTLSGFEDKKAYLIAFICVHCPYVKHMEKEFSSLANEYIGKGVAVIAVNSNDPEYDTDDGLEGMKDQAERCGFEFPYLIDESQEVAKAYKAACTPDLYVFDGSKKLVYRGQFDETRPGSGNPNGGDLRRALDAVLNGEIVGEDQKPSSGCNIKWRSGNEPDY